MAIRYTTEEKKYVLLKGNILKRMEAERVSDEQMHMYWELLLHRIEAI